MLYPHINPIAFSVGPLSIHWYGVMYLLAFACAFWMARFRAARSSGRWSVTDVDDMLLVGMIGVVVGGRLGHMVFYDLQITLHDPVEVFRLWNGGMSFHGGLLGVLAALWWWARKQKRAFLEVMDFVAPLVPLGLFFGRVGNFINNELWGVPTTLPWGMAQVPGGVLHHPTQLYEAFLEGLVLFALVWLYSRKPRALGRVSGLFALGYGIARLGVEFVRLPEANLGYLAFGWLTMGQVLSLPMVILGVWLLWRTAPAVSVASKSASGKSAAGSARKNRAR